MCVLISTVNYTTDDRNDELLDQFLGTFDKDNTSTSLTSTEWVDIDTPDIDLDEDIHEFLTEQVMENNNLTRKNEEEIRDDSTTTVTTTPTVVIPSMLPTQILLDQFYADNKHVTTN